MSAINLTKTTRVKHGQTKTRLFSIWSCMIDRCRNQRNIAYKRYGGRGIKVCERWKSFVSFKADMGEPPTSEHQLDRFPNNNGNYEPGNCRWATAKEQANNRRSSKLLMYSGRVQTMRQWCDELGLKYSTVTMRLWKYGWTIEQAFESGRYELRGT